MTGVRNEDHVDVVLIGAGIMSATLGVLLQQLQPEWTIRVLERLDSPASESTDPWNNAGTGHSGFCELNYTPRRSDGSIDVSKAIGIAEQFQQTRQFWSFLVDNGTLPDPLEFIHAVPHMSFVEGSDDVAYLRARHAALIRHPLFDGMQFSDDPTQLAEWMPLMFPGRARNAPVAATYMAEGTDVDFGALSRALFHHLEATGVDVRFHRQVRSLERGRTGWTIRSRDTATGSGESVQARFVFVGAGGSALPLLQRARDPEVRGLGGFPFSGRFFRCTNPALIERHNAKVYGKPPLGAPPMSMPHLDTRVVSGKRGLMFGPYAGLTPKFMKAGSWFDLPGSIRTSNIGPMLGAGKDNLDLAALLARQVFQSNKARLAELRKFIPDAEPSDWELITAGYRVQLIEKSPQGRGILQFGTKVVANTDGTLAGLLGASPGASTAVPIMLDILQRCFPTKTEKWKPQLQQMIPSYMSDRSSAAEEIAETRERTATSLQLKPTFR